MADPTIAAEPSLAPSSGVALRMLAVLGVAIAGTAVAMVLLLQAPATPEDPAVYHGDGYAIRVPPEYGLAFSEPAGAMWINTADRRVLLINAFPVFGATTDAGAMEAGRAEMIRRLGLAEATDVGPVETINLPAGPALSVKANVAIAGGPLSSYSIVQGRRGWVIWIAGFDPEIERRTIESFVIETE